MNLALFDFDGTVTYGDTFAPFIKFAVPRLRFASGALLLGPQIVAYKLGWLRATALRRAISRRAFSGRAPSEIEVLGARYSEGLARVVRPDGRINQRGGTTRSAQSR